jgi:hypothetical protein
MTYEEGECFLKLGDLLFSKRVCLQCDVLAIYSYPRDCSPGVVDDAGIAGSKGLPRDLLVPLYCIYVVERERVIRGPKV